MALLSAKSCDSRLNTTGALAAAELDWSGRRKVYSPFPPFPRFPLPAISHFPHLRPIPLFPFPSYISVMPTGVEMPSCIHGTMNEMQRQKASYSVIDNDHIQASQQHYVKHIRLRTVRGSDWQLEHNFIERRKF